MSIFLRDKKSNGKQLAALLSSSLLVFLISVLTHAVATAAQQSAIDWNDRRLSEIEKLHLDARLRVVENDMYEVKWLTRLVTTTLVGQFIMAGLALRKGKQ